MKGFRYANHDYIFSKKPKDIFKQFKFQLEKEMKIVDYRELSPYEEDHAIFVAKF